MKVQTISNQNFTAGHVIVTNKLNQHEYKILKESLNFLQESIRKHDFDLFLKHTQTGEFIIGTEPNIGYVLKDRHDLLKKTKLVIEEKLLGPKLERKKKEIEAYKKQFEIF